MAEATWPAGLPQDVLRGFRRGVTANAVISSPVELGPPKTRPRYSVRGPQPITVAVMLDSREQVATWETFFFETLAHGALPFDWVDPLDGTATTCLIDPGRRDQIAVVQVGANTFRVDLPLLVEG
jgi:hypothetical protein